MKNDCYLDELFSEFDIGTEGAVQLADKIKVLKEKANKKEKGIQTKTVKDLFLAYIQDKKIPVIKKGTSLYSAIMSGLDETKLMVEGDGYSTKLTNYDDIPVLLVFKPESKNVQYLWYGKEMKFNNKRSQVYMVNAKTLRQYMNTEDPKDSKPAEESDTYDLFPEILDPETDKTIG